MKPPLWITPLVRHHPAQPAGAKDRLQHRRVIGTTAHQQPAVHLDHLARDVAKHRTTDAYSFSVAATDR